MEVVSNMMDAPSNLNQRIAERVCELRTKQNLSLDALARKTGVSRSMISLIERAECSPTAVVLEKLAAGFGVMLASLFDAQAKKQESRYHVVRFKDQPQWRDPDSGYVRRNVSPPGLPELGQIVEVRFPAKARIHFESSPRGSHMHQQVWVLGGAMEIGVGEERHLLHKGDCLAMQLDQPVTFHNPTSKPAHYAVVMVSETPSKR